MGTGWRRAFCTTVPITDGESNKTDKQSEQSFHSQNPSPSIRNRAKFGFLSGGSNPSTPRLLPESESSLSLSCETTTVGAAQTALCGNEHSLISPKLQCKTKTPKSMKSSMGFLGSNPSSPRSPFSILKNSLRLSRNSCGVCMQSVKTGQGMAIYTAECSHSFHFPCIASHVKKQSNLMCPVCNSTWRDVPLLAIHKLQSHHDEDKEGNHTNITKHEESKQQQRSPRLPNLKTKPEPEQEPESESEPEPVLIIKQSDTRTYDDDEPLLSPTAGAKFLPIPEANENEELEDEEIQEFQGFFVNPISSDESVSHMKEMRNVEVKLMPEAAIVSVSQTHETCVVVLKIRAPPPSPPPPRQMGYNGHMAHVLDRTRRAPIDLVTVLDVSGTMSGSKLQMLKRAMRLVISSLGSNDRLSIVAYSTSPARLLPLRRMTAQGQKSAQRIINRLALSQGSCVGDALRKATKVLEDRRERNPVASIMLFSGGHDESGVHTDNSNQRQRSTHMSSTRFAHIEIPVHSAGFGEKAGYSREPAEDAFAKCVGGLLSVVVQDLRIQLGLASSSDPAEISAIYSCNGRPTMLDSVCVRLGDLYAEEERELLVELRIPASIIGTHHVLSVKCSYRDPATLELITGREQALLVPKPQAVRSTLPKMERLRSLFIMTRAIAESRRLIEHNELSSAYHLLSSARALLLQYSSVSADEYICGLEAELTELQWRRKYQHQIEQQQMIQRRRANEREVGVFLDENGEPLTPTSAWRAAEKLAKVAMMKKSLNRGSDLHGFENARF